MKTKVLILVIPRSLSKQKSYFEVAHAGWGVNLSAKTKRSGGTAKPGDTHTGRCTQEATATLWQSGGGAGGLGLPGRRAVPTAAVPRGVPTHLKRGRSISEARIAALPAYIASCQFPPEVRPAVNLRDALPGLGFRRSVHRVRNAATQ